MDLTGLTKLNGYRIMVKGHNVVNIYTTSLRTAERIVKEFTAKGYTPKMTAETIFQRESGNLLAEIKLTVPSTEDLIKEQEELDMASLAIKLSDVNITLEEIKQYLIFKGEALK